MSVREQIAAKLDRQAFDFELMIESARKPLPSDHHICVKARTIRQIATDVRTFEETGNLPGSSIEGLMTPRRAIEIEVSVDRQIDDDNVLADTIGESVADAVKRFARGMATVAWNGKIIAHVHRKDLNA